MCIYTFPELIRKETENSKIQITNNIKPAMKCHLSEKSLGPDGFTLEFYQTFKEQLLIILQQHKKLKKKQFSQTCSVRSALVTLGPRLNKDTRKLKKPRATLPKTFNETLPD